MINDAQNSCHELLLRFAGRLPDRQLWRFRDWLAAGAVDALARTLPLSLLRERVAITPSEWRLLTGALVDAGGDPERLNAIPWVDEIGDLDYTFTADSPEWMSMGDSVAVVLGAVLHGRSEVIDVRGTWRRHRSGAGSAMRVVLVTVSSASMDGSARLTGELQRVLRALGTTEPGVEVMPDGFEPSPYHRAALAASEPMLPWVTAAREMVPS